jgi:hypothetical protein
MNRKLQIFVLFNLVLVIVVGVVLFLPIWESLTRGRENVQILERRYSAESRRDSEQNELLNIAREIKHYSEIVPTLAGISTLAGYFNLSTVEFSTNQVIVAGEADFSRLYEKRGRAEYEGSLQDFVGFLYNLNGVYVRSLSLENTRLNIDFSVFGSD